MEMWISWHLMKISERIDAHRTETNMQKRTWRKNDTEGSHSFTHSAPPICEVWHIIAWRVGNECLCHSSFYESEALTHTHTHTHTHTQRLLLLLLGYSAYKSSRSSVLPNHALLRHAVRIVTRLRAGRSVLRIPTAERNFSLFRNVQTGSRAFRDFPKAPKKRLRPRPFYKCGMYSNLADAGRFYKIKHIFIYIYETTWLHLSETVLKRLASPSSCPNPYMIILFPSGNNACMKHKRSNWERNAADG
jgi:hypothetical protein